MSSFSLKSRQGLTLIELLVTIVIIMIIVMVSVPNYSNFVANERFAVATNQLYNAYRFARNEALKTSSSMILDAKEIGGVSDWANGWQVKNSDGDLLLESKKPHESITVSGNVVTVNGTGSATSVDMSIVGPNKANCLTILSSGQSQLKEGACT